jgi:hypothetical protein
MLEDNIPKDADVVNWQLARPDNIALLLSQWLLPKCP